MSKLTVGYVVQCAGHAAMMMDEGDRQLYFGQFVSLFPTRQRARGAIKRTIDARKREHGTNFEVEFGRLYVQRIVQVNA